MEYGVGVAIWGIRSKEYNDRQYGAVEVQVRRRPDRASR
jgi:hypothetical protein